MTLILGVDPSAKKIAALGSSLSTHTFLCRDYDLYALPGKKKATKQTNETIAYAGTCMDLLLTDLLTMDQGPLYAWVEAPLVGRGSSVSSTLKQVFIGGVIRERLVNAGFTVYDVAQATWKKDVCGNGHAKKPDVERVLKTLWPKAHLLAGGDGDLLDAGAIAYYGRDVLRRAALIRP